MIVKELIELLQTMPQDAVVIFDQFSDVTAMDVEDVKLRKSEDKEIILRNGRYETYKSHWWSREALGDPNFVTVVNFPGN